MAKLDNDKPDSIAQTDAPSLHDVLVTLESNTSIPGTRKRDLRSAIHRFASQLRSTPAQIPANLQRIEQLIHNIHPAQHGMSIKTFQNIKSNLLAALKIFRANGRPVRTRQKLSTSWQRLYDQIPTKRIKHGLSRFIHYLSNHDIAPEDVADAVVTEFALYSLNNNLISEKRCREIYRRTTRLWNVAAGSIAGWPDIQLNVPDHRKPRTTHPLSDFPVAFQEDVKAYLAWLEDKDPLAENQPPKRLKPRTLRLRFQQIELGASALVTRGYDIGKITSLSDLVDVDAIKEILRFYLNKYDDEPTSFIQNLAITLKAIATHWVKVPEDQLAAIKTIKRHLDQQKVGMTEDNKRALRQFDDDQNRRLLLELPERLMQLSANQPTAKAAITAQKAIAIEMLLMAPVRMANLIGLRFDQHLVKPAGDRGLYHLVLQEADTKNGQPYEVQLPKALTQYIDRYRDHLLPAIIIEPNPYLFPNKSGGHKSQGTLAQQIKETIEKHTGLNFTGHKFRHLCGKFFLEANPGQYETVRQLLGHKNLKTTVAFYTGMNTREATRVFDDLLVNERERLKTRKKRHPT